MDKSDLLDINNKDVNNFDENPVYASKFSLNDVVLFEITKYLPYVRAVIIDVRFTEEKVWYTLAINRDDEISDEMILNGKLKKELRPIYMFLDDSISVAYSKENEETDDFSYPYIILRNIASQFIRPIIQPKIT